LQRTPRSTRRNPNGVWQCSRCASVHSKRFSAHQRNFGFTVETTVSVKAWSWIARALFVSIAVMLRPSGPPSVRASSNYRTSAPAVESARSPSRILSVSSRHALKMNRITPQGQATSGKRYPPAPQIQLVRAPRGQWFVRLRWRLTRRLRWRMRARERNRSHGDALQ
jgi:hypothetical protein